jgi:hypothetical protein
VAKQPTYVPQKKKNDSSDDDYEQPAGGGKSPSKSGRGRGRPRNQDRDMSEERPKKPAVTGTGSGRRGRPPKSAMLDAEDHTPKKKYSAVVKTDENGNPILKKRGRPPKNAQSECTVKTVVAKTLNNDSLNTVTKKAEN